MRQSGGTANPALVSQLVRERLGGPCTAYESAGESHAGSLAVPFWTWRISIALSPWLLTCSYGESMAITDYRILVGVGSNPVEATIQLRGYVLGALNSGWQPMGGVSITAERLSNGVLTVAATQAMGK